MLIDFTVQNFRSFRTAERLTLVAGNLTELAGNTFEFTDDLRLLKSAVVYGPNASGKSNFIRAVECMRDIVVLSVDEADFWSGIIGCEPFRLDKSETQEPTSFEANFAVDGVRFQYGFSVLLGYIQREWLRAYPKKVVQQWFTRENDGGDTKFTFSPHLTGEKKRLTELMCPDALFLSVAAKFNHQQLSPIYGWFKDRLQIIRDARVSTPAMEYTCAGSRIRFHKFVIDSIKAVDLGIDDFEVHLPPEPSEEKLEGSKPDKQGARWRPRRNVKVLTVHKIPDSDKSVQFDLQEESFGMCRFFGLIGHLIDGLQANSVTLVDELDASMHPMLTRVLVGLFNNAKTNPHNVAGYFYDA